MAAGVTLGILFYGDYPQLAQRCLASLRPALASKSPVQDIRIGFNAVSDRTRRYVEAWGREQARRPCVVRTFTPEGNVNVGKYPLMRRMIGLSRCTTVLPTPEELWMWFDDDTFLSPFREDWWSQVLAAAARASMLGQLWKMPLQGNQWAWVQSQPWYRAEVGLPPVVRCCHGKCDRGFRFCQGAWWVIWTSLLFRFDWPCLDLHHNGGDSMLGELCRHQKLVLRQFDVGVRINADAQGRHSKSVRRGLHQGRVGWNYAGQPLDRSHQDFVCRWEQL